MCLFPFVLWHSPPLHPLLSFLPSSSVSLSFSYISTCVLRLCCSEWRGRDGTSTYTHIQHGQLTAFLTYFLPVIGATRTSQAPFATSSFSFLFYSFIILLIINRRIKGIDTRGRLCPIDGSLLTANDLIYLVSEKRETEMMDDWSSLNRSKWVASFLPQKVVRLPKR